MTTAQISLRFDARHFMRDTVVMANLTPVGEDLLEAARSLQGETIELRRSIHAEPEMGCSFP
jgi:hypothetical protein